MPGGSSTESTGKSPLKSTLVTPRTHAAVPITLLEPYGLSRPDSARELWWSNSRSRASLASQARLKPSDLFSFLVQVSEPAMARSPQRGSKPAGQLLALSLPAHWSVDGL